MRLKLAVLIALPVLLLAQNMAEAQRVVRIVGGRDVTEEPAAPATPADARLAVEPTAEERVQLEALIEELGAGSLARRERAMSEIASFEDKALGPIRGAKDHDNDEIAWRCALLEEVINSGQGELFLASRRMNMTIADLNAHFQNTDVTPLLSLLRTRGQPGMIALWANVLGRLSMRTEIYPAAQICREVEGVAGYGIALSRAAAGPDFANYPFNLLSLVLLLPPDDARDAVELLARAQLALAGTPAQEEVQRVAAGLRGVFSAQASLAAIGGRREGREPGTPGQGTARRLAELRTVMALAMVETADEKVLATAAVPPVQQMSPLVLDAWLSLLVRCGMHARIESSLVDLLGGNADARRISMVAAALAQSVPVAEIAGYYESLPLEGQLAVLDTWWLNPRDPLVLQPLLVRLLADSQETVRVGAARVLAQLRAPSTAKALVQCALAHPANASAYYEALAPMADLLPLAAPDEWKTLLAMVARADAINRPDPSLMAALASSGDSTARAALLQAWRVWLPRNELALCAKVLLSQPRTPAGAYALAMQAYALMGMVTFDDYVLRLGPDTFALLRTLLQVSDEKGFALLTELAADHDDFGRIWAIGALAAAGRDSELIEGWIRIATGETPDVDGEQMAFAIGLSATPQADEFRRRQLGQPSRKASFMCLFVGVSRGIGSITAQELSDAITARPEELPQFMHFLMQLGQPLSQAAARAWARDIAFGDGGGFMAGESNALLLAGAGINMLELLYGSQERPEPRNADHLLATALFGEPVRARAIVSALKLKDDGSNFMPMAMARALLGIAEPAECARLTRYVRATAGSGASALLRYEAARTGDVPALRSLLDPRGPSAVRFTPGNSADARMSAERWGGGSMQLNPVARAFASATPSRLTQLGSLSKILADAPAEWHDWWSSRRGLIAWDATKGKYFVQELP